MPQYNILIACDQKYYDDWGHPLLISIYQRNPWTRGFLHCHIVNPSDVKVLDYVNYTYENRTFTSEESKISYLQSSRFLEVAKRIDLENFFITLDADTICTRSFSKNHFADLFNKINILKHRKAGHWLAGFVTFNSINFAKDYERLLYQEPVEEWKVGRDQEVLAVLSKHYEFNIVDSEWMHYGKNSHNSIFYTLKGDQKNQDKYLSEYKKYQI